MKRKVASVLLLVSTFASGEEVVEWPDLSAFKYVSQRTATELDVREGAAVFLLQSEGEAIGNPMDLLIPQYAIHTDDETGEESKVVLIQAEEANGQEVFGAVIFGSGEFMAGLSNEFKLLGKDPK